MTVQEAGQEQSVNLPQQCKMVCGRRGCVQAYM